MANLTELWWLLDLQKLCCLAAILYALYSLTQLEAASEEE